LNAETLRSLISDSENAAEVLRETGAEAHDRGELVNSAHAVGVAEGMSVVVAALRLALDEEAAEVAAT
jgi:hypothetical protein